MNRGRGVLPALVVCLLVLAGVAAGTPVGSPTVEVTLPDARVSPGEATTLELQVSNDAELSLASTTNPALNERVTTASGVTVRVRSGSSPLGVRTGEVTVGSLPDGAVRTVGVEVVIDEDAEPGRYRLPYRVEYTYTRSIAEANGVVEERTVTEERHVSVRVVEEARLAVVNVSTDVRVGGSGTASLTVENVGSATARDSRLALGSRNADVTFGGAADASRFVGTLDPGERRTVAYAVTVDGTARPGPYAVEAVGTFEDRNGRTVTTDPLPVAIRPGVGPRFVVVSVGGDPVVGGTGTVTVEVRNAGGEDLTDAAVSLRSGTPALSVDGGPVASRYVGSWPAGEVRSVGFDVAADTAAAARSYALEGAVAYDTPEGVRSRAGPLTVPVPVGPDLEFALESVESDLRVGREGTLRGTVRNRGDRTARNAVVVVESASPSVGFPESVQPVGDLEPGTEASFAFDARVPRSADPGSRAFTVRVRYEDDEGTQAASEGLSVGAEVGPEPELVDAEPVDAVFDIDSDNRLVVELTNTAEEPLRDVEARLTVGPPFTSEAPSSFVDGLGPGETARLAFGLTVSEDAVASTYAVAVTVTAETSSGETVTAGPTLLPVSVAEEPPGAGQVGTLAAGAVLVAVLLGAGYWWLRR